MKFSKGTQNLDLRYFNKNQYDSSGLGKSYKKVVFSGVAYRLLSTTRMELPNQACSASISSPQNSLDRLLWWLSGKESACQCRRCRFDPSSGKIPWRRKWQPTPVFLPGKSHGQRSLEGLNPWGCKKLDMTTSVFLPGSDGKESTCSAGDLDSIPG